MNKLSFSILLLAVSFGAGCKSGNEELAVFEGGKIIRQDIRDYYALQNIQINETTGSIKNQTSVLENLAIQSLVQKENSGKKVEETADYKNLREISERQLTVNLYIRNFLNQVKEDRDMEMAEIQFIFMRGGSEKSEAVFKEISALSDKKAVNEFIMKNTEEEGRKALAGYLEPQCINCLASQLTELVFKEGIEKKDGKFYKKEFEGNSYIYRITEVKKVKAKKLEAYLKGKFKDFREMAIEYQNAAQNENQKKSAEYYAEDDPKLSEKAKMTANHYTKKFEEKIWPDEFEKLLQDSGYQIAEVAKQSPDILSKEKPETVLLSKGETKFTVADLEKEFAKINGYRNSSPNRSAEMLEMQRFLHNLIIPGKVIADSDKGKTVRASEQYKTAEKFMDRSLYWALFVKDIQTKNREVSDAEVKSVYEAGKSTAYAKMSFDQAKDRIRHEMIQSKSEMEMKKSVQDLKTKYKLQFFTDKLKAGTV